MFSKRSIFILLVFIFVMSLSIISSCKKDSVNNPDEETPPTPTPYNIAKIPNFRNMPTDPANPLTVEGIALGKKLFFDPILSKDSSISCESCHRKENSFSDPRRFSMGVDGTMGKRQSMALVNLAWYDNKFFWDGRVNTLRAQAEKPIEDPTEMHLPFSEAEHRLQNHPEYVNMFWKAFGTKTVTKDLITKALEQFEKTLISYNSKYDKYTRGEVALDTFELRGLTIFNTEKGDCFHCHTTSELFVHPTQVFSNNGMDAAATVDDFVDKGVGSISGIDAEKGKFKIPTLRNLAFTAPYMHDGRFGSLEEVIDMYNEGFKHSPTVDNILIEKAAVRYENTGEYGLQLSNHEKECLKRFLLSLSDSSFVR
jgi:cytochrome c peroxidase